VIILDIRLPPGREECWRDLYLDSGGDRTNAKLGLRLLSWLFHDNHDGQVLPQRPQWAIRPQQIGVFSVEARLGVAGLLERFGVGVFHEKRPGLPDTIVLDIVKEVLEQAGDAAVHN